MDATMGRGEKTYFSVCRVSYPPKEKKNINLPPSIFGGFSKCFLDILFCVVNFDNHLPEV
jgi:hypothetical protein